MEKISYNLVFNRKKRLNKRGMALVQVEAYLNRKKMYFSTKIYLKPEQWDAKRKMVKNWLSPLKKVKNDLPLLRGLSIEFFNKSNDMDFPCCHSPSSVCSIAAIFSYNIRFKTFALG